MGWQWWTPWSLYCARSSYQVEARSIQDTHWTSVLPWNSKSRSLGSKFEKYRSNHIYDHLDMIWPTDFNVLLDFQVFTLDITIIEWQPTLFDDCRLSTMHILALQWTFCGLEGQYLYTSSSRGFVCCSPTLLLALLLNRMTTSPPDWLATIPSVILHDG